MFTSTIKAGAVKGMGQLLGDAVLQDVQQIHRDKMNASPPDCVRRSDCPACLPPAAAKNGLLADTPAKQTVEVIIVITNI